MKQGFTRWLYDGRKSQRLLSFVVYVSTMLMLVGYATGYLPAPFWLVAGPCALVAVWYIGSNLIHAGMWIMGRVKK